MATENATQSTASTDTAALDALVDGIIGDSAPAPEPEAVQAAELDADAAADDAAPDEPGEAPAQEAAPAKAEEVKTDADDLLDTKGDHRFEVLARREKKQREAHAARLAEIRKAAEEAEQVKADLDEFRQAKRLAARDPAAVLKALGLKPEQFKTAAQDLFGEALGEDAPSTWREQRQTRTLAQEIEDMRREMASLKEQASQAQREAENTRLRSEYESRIKGALDAAADGTRYVQRLAKRDRSRAVSALFALAEQRAREEGEIPDPAGLISKLEEALADEARLFVDDEAPATPKSPKQKAGESKTATLTNRNTVSATKPKRAPVTDDELIADIVAELNNR